ncbi:class I ribonucleotide reductase maintenance protein YfaE [Shigella sonnei]
MARVTLRITGTQLLCQDEHPSLLAALESHNVAVEYQCREGYCGLLSHPTGRRQVDWIAEPLAFIQPGEILPCCCRAKAILKSRCELVLTPDTTLIRLIWPTTIT